MNKDSETGHTAMTNTADRDAQINDCRRLVSRAGCLSVDMVSQITKLATALEKLRMTHARSVEGAGDVRQIAPANNLAAKLLPVTA